MHRRVGRLPGAAIGAGAGFAAVLIGLPAISAGSAWSQARSGEQREPATACSVCDVNLIANPGAEAGVGADYDSVVKVPDWKPTGTFTAMQYAYGGGDLSATTPGPPKRGKNYFYGGPGGAVSTGTQTVGLPPGAVAAGTTFVLAGWLGGYDGQGDYAQLSAEFETAAGIRLALVTVGPVTAAQRHGVTGLFYRGVGEKVPLGTRRIFIKLMMVRQAGSDNDGLADNLSLVFSAPK